MEAVFTPEQMRYIDAHSAVDVAVCKGRLFMAWNPDENNRFPLKISEIKQS
jgi:hypothetical protein